MRPTVTRLTEVDPRHRRLHVSGEMHPGELTARGYVREGGEWVLDLRRPADPRADRDRMIEEFQALASLGYAFAEGDEWAPADLFRKYRDAGAVSGDPPFV